MTVATLLRRFAAAALVFVLVGAVMVAYWRRTGASPAAGDLGLYLLALPLGLIGGYWLLRWGIDGRKAKTSAATAAATGADVADDGPQPDRVLHLLAHAVLIPAGASAAEAVAALVEPKRPALHPQFKDDGGMPVFAAAVDGVDPDAIAEALREFLAAGSQPHADIDAVFAEEHLRALALLEPVADELLQVALAADADEMDPYARVAEVAPASVLRVRLLLPVAWPVAARQTAADWLLAKATTIGYRVGHVSVDVIAVEAASDVWRLLDQLGQARARESESGRDSDRHLLLGAHSLLAEAAIEQLSQQRPLLGSGRPEGMVPGEGAAGILISASVAAVDGVASVNPDVDLDVPLPLRLHRVSSAPALAGVPSRRVSQHAADLLARSLVTAAQPAHAVAALLSDGDHRPSRAVELAGAMAIALPDLDPIVHGLHLGIACGDLGAVAPLALIAAAAAQAEQSAAPVLAISVADDTLRFALAVSPLPMPANPVADAPTRHAPALAQPA